TTTAANSSRKTGFRPRAGSSGTASTILSGPAGALGFTGELAADLFAPLNAYESESRTQSRP
ncbi:MAG: hypothetical protein JXA30_09900, partial [Deltaproteobacteria bacterium]|nr:hypothetical protein [Deltaproteobacteria bacterium]